MANTKSAQKALRASARRRVVNIKTIRAYKEARKATNDALKQGKVSAAKKTLNTAYSQIDMAVKKNVIHKKTGSRYKSRLAQAVKKAEQEKK